MLTVRCSRCGASAPIALSSDVYQCAHCGWSEPHPPHVMQQIAAARSLLFSVNVRSRQLSGVQSAALRWSSVLIGLYVGVMLLFLAAFAGCATCVGSALADDSPAVWGWLGGLAVLPFLVFLVGGLIGVPVQLSARSKLERSCAAAPPSRAGEPARCHVCGGPVVAHGARAVVRCSYCAADNVVTSKAVALAANRAVLDIGDFERAVQKESRSATITSVAALLVLPIAALASPVIALVIWGGMVVFAANFEQPVDRKLQFVEVDIAQGRCLAQYFPDKPAGQRVQLSSAFGDARPALLERPGMKPFDGTAMVGKRAAIPGMPEFSDATILRTWSTPLFPGSVYARLKNKSGGEYTIEVMNGICFK